MQAQDCDGAAQETQSERILRELRAVNPLVRALWMAADGMYETKDGALTKISGWEPPEPDERMDGNAVTARIEPPPEHSNKIAHWLEFDGYPSVHGWMRVNPEPFWVNLFGGRLNPDTAAAAGWHYLGPAEWRPQKRFLVTGPDGVLRGVERDARIAELEAELATEKAEHDEVTDGWEAEVARLRGLLKLYVPDGGMSPRATQDAAVGRIARRG